MHELGWSPQVLGIKRRSLEFCIVKEAREARPQVREVLFWIANPGENVGRDRRAVELISKHSQGIKIQLIAGRVVSRSFGMEHFIDLISRFVCDSLCQIGEDLARPLEPSPIRICETQHCPRFFVRDGKHLHCEKLRSVKVSRSTDENRRYKFIRDNLRIPAGKLKKKVASGRLENARDGIWKLKCVIQMCGITVQPSAFGSKAG